MSPDESPGGDGADRSAPQQGDDADREPGGDVDHRRTGEDAEHRESARNPEHQESGGDDRPEGVDDQWHGEPPEGWSQSDDGDVFEGSPEGADEPERIEPGAPRLENTAFVLLGVLTSVGLLVHVILAV